MQSSKLSVTRFVVSGPGASGSPISFSGEKSFPAFEPASRPPHSSGDTPQRPDAGWRRNSSSSHFRARHSGAPAPIPPPSVRCGRRRLGSRAIGRLWRFVARARPFARIAPRRGLRSRHRRPCRATTFADSFLHSRPSSALRSRACAPSALAPLKRARSAGLRPPRFGYAQTPLGF